MARAPIGLATLLLALLAAHVQCDCDAVASGCAAQLPTVLRYQHPLSPSAEKAALGAAETLPESLRLAYRASVDHDLLQRMAIRESERRQSPEMQRIYEAAERTDLTNWTIETERMQEQVVAELAPDLPPSSKKIYVNALRIASQIWPEEPFWRETQLFVRFNRARPVTFDIGDSAPDTPLIPLADWSAAEPDVIPATQNLLSLTQPGRPLLIVSASYS